MENAEWYGLNIYQHCDPTAQTVDDLGGWSFMRDDFAALNHPVPIVVAEYGCVDDFPAVDGYAAQRTWLQVDALYREDYVDVFAGGVAFEFSTEKFVTDQFTDTVNNPFPYFDYTMVRWRFPFLSKKPCYLSSRYQTLTRFNFCRSLLCISSSRRAVQLWRGLLQSR